MATDYAAIYRTMNTPRLVTEAWQQTEDPVLRGHVVAQMQTRGDDAFPSAAMAEREEMAGLYPDYSDPEFAIRLYQKREFHEARAVAAAVGDGTADPCTSAAAEKVFELTPVQRIVSRFLHPSTPYHGMLLFHGVGVGKTCSAVTIAENFLEVTPNKKVIVLVPQALQDNFKRTVFDAGKLAWDDTTGSWTARQCTGVSYLERLGLTETRDEATIRYKVAEDMRARYTVIGYQAFANWIERTLKKHVPPSLTDMRARAAAENEVLRQLFSDHLIIVDEAHNLRDTGADDAEPAAGVAQAPAGTDAESPVAGEAAENAGGKALNPYLKRIVLNAEGLRLVLMTATPMYNSAPEIVLLLNYLRMNDTKKETSAIRMVDLFDKEGRLLADPRAQRLLERASRAYVSYMRGENPYTFPLRMRPAAASAAPADEWPTVSATSTPVNLTEVREALNAMPLVFTEPVPGSPVDVVLRAATSRAAAATDSKSADEEEESDSKSEEEAKAEVAQKATDVILDYRMQMANITYPNQMFGTAGWNNYFTAARPTVGKRKIRVYLPRTQPEGAFAVDSVFGEDALALHAPKMAKVLASVKSARGICFVYSRYISGGALPMALAFERAGFQRRMADGTLVSLLAGVPAPPPICAICGAAHSGAAAADGHPFRPACYVLLTSEDDISPNFPGLVQQAATWPADPEWGPLGGNVKVVIGSQVASEGLDLKCVREMHVLDSWYHLNRTDQIIGRAIRYCSHSALRAVEERTGLSPMALNNCLIYLHALKPAGFESADMYAYRIAIAKAIRVGEVQRLLKKHAWDCNLELEAITFTGLPGRDQVDAQGRPLTKYSINDVDFTTYCDYRVCEHKCVKAIPAALRIDASTYTAGDARRLLLDKQDLVRRHFDETVMVPETTIQREYADLPWEIASEALMELLDPRRFRLTRPDGVEGYLLKRAGYLVFQPIAVRATEIPITMRYGRAWQLRRRFLDGTLPVFGRAEEIPLPAPRLARATEAVAVAAAAGAASAPVAVGTALTDRLVAQWEEWYNYVMAAGTAAAVLPSYMASTMRIWGWILDHYKTVPAATEVALRWWVDRLSYEERRAAMELATIRSAADAGSVGTLVAILEQGLFRTPSMTAYRIYNPETAEVEVWCRSATADAEWTPCSSALRPVIEKRLGNDPVPLSGDSSVAGAIVGFMAPKKGRLVFKTLDTSKIRKQSTVGAECGNVTNLGEHRPRVKLLHEAGRSIASLEPLMLPDDDATHDATGARARMDAGKPIHLNDLTHQPLCAYLEFLARLMDHLRAQRRRWFLGPIEASVSGLRGRK